MCIRDSRNNVQKWLAIDDLHSGSEIDYWPKEHRHLLVLTEESVGLGCPKAQADLIETLELQK